ncbi:MAG TPA: hypothetical protein VFS58_07185 [Steroidobacteraceae bacterium]|nr:hypothetical protein [Steroidobacteraceae bacterium]
MTTNRMILSIAMLATAASANADVTINTTTSGKASFIDVGGDGVSQIKGTRQRTDQLIGGKSQALIIDIDGRRFVSLDAKKKAATVTPLDTIADELQKIGTGAMSATLTKTTQVRQVAGFPCTVHDVKLSLPFSPTGEAGQGLDLLMVLTGTVCLSTAVPGLADYQNFYKAAADSGFIFGDPRAAKTPTGAAQAKAYAELTRKMAEAGMALESHVTIDATGNNPMAGMFSKLAKSDITTTVTSLVTGDLLAEAFEIPADFKVKTQK